MINYHSDNPVFLTTGVLKVIKIHVCTIFLLFGSTFTDIKAQTCPISDSSEAIGVRAYIDQIHILRTSISENPEPGPEDEDEFRIRVIGFDPNLNAIDFVNPFTDGDQEGVDGIYRGKTGFVGSSGNPSSWKNGTNHLPHFPEIWDGSLSESGSQAQFLVVVTERDHQGGTALKSVLGDILGACSEIAGGSNEKDVAEGCDAANEAVQKYIPDDDMDDYIGSFLLHVKNVDGELQTTYIVADAKSLGLEGATTTFLGRNAGEMFVSEIGSEVTDQRTIVSMIDNQGHGHYQAHVVVEQICPSEVTGAHRMLATNDRENGTCRNDPVEIILADGSSRRPVPKGESFYMKAPTTRKLKYKCGSSIEIENLFDRSDYWKWAVNMTFDGELEVFPYIKEPYVKVGSIQPIISSRVVWEPESLSIPKTRRTWNPNDSLSTCDRLLRQDWESWPIIPLFNWFSSSRADNSLMTDTSWYGCTGDQESPDYSFKRVEGLVFSPKHSQPKGTIPLYRWYNEVTNDNLTTTHPSYSGEDRRNGDVINGYSYRNIAGYIYPPSTTPREDLVAIHTWHSKIHNDFYTTTDSAWRGELGKWHKQGYPYYNFRHEGYVLRVD